MNTSKKLTALLSKAGIRQTKVTILGIYVHIDSYSKYDDKLQHMLTSAGFTVLSAKNINHLDGYKGYRISAKLK